MSGLGLLCTSCPLPDYLCLITRFEKSDQGGGKSFVYSVLEIVLEYGRSEGTVANESYEDLSDLFVLFIA